MNKRLKLILLLSASVLVCLSGCKKENSSSTENSSSESSSSENTPRATITRKAISVPESNKTGQLPKYTLPSGDKNLDKQQSRVNDLRNKRKGLVTSDELHTIDWSQYQRGHSDETTTTVDTDEED